MKRRRARLVETDDTYQPKRLAAVTVEVPVAVRCCCDNGECLILNIRDVTHKETTVLGAMP